MLADSEEGILPESPTTQTGDPVDGTKQMGGLGGRGEGGERGWAPKPAEPIASPAVPVNRAEQKASL